MHRSQCSGSYLASVERPLSEAGICSGHRAIGEHRPRPSGAGRLLCTTCGERVGTSVRALPLLYAECEQALGPGSGGLTQRVSGSRAAGLALNEKAMDARSAMVGVLTSWSDLLVAEREVPAPGGRTVRQLADFVTRHLDWLLTHPAADDFVDEVATAETAARRVVDGDGTPRELGQCTQPGCGSVVRSVVRAGAGGGNAVRVGCDTGHTLSPQQWLLLSRGFGS